MQIHSTEASGVRARSTHRTQKLGCCDGALVLGGVVSTIYHPPSTIYHPPSTIYYISIPQPRPEPPLYLCILQLYLPTPGWLAGWVYVLCLCDGDGILLLLLLYTHQKSQLPPTQSICLQLHLFYVSLYRI